MKYTRHIEEAIQHLKGLDYEALSEIDKALGIIHAYMPEFWSESGCRDIQIVNTKLLSRSKP